LLQFEREAFAAGIRRVAGLDEAGRGPLAGPVVAACVMLPAGIAEDVGPLDGLTDSKQLTRARREHFDRILRGLPGVGIGIGRASVAEIDRWNILRATHRAMARAIRALNAFPISCSSMACPFRGCPVRPAPSSAATP
jgi:ribonuclease HII